jgi:hypothetical protein
MGHVASAKASDQPSARTQTCARSTLTQALDAYFQALANHDPSSLPGTSTVKFTENGKALRLGEGKLWPTAGEALLRRDVLDTVQCGALAQAVIQSDGKDGVLAVRIKLDGSQISEIETLFAPPGFFFSNPKNILNTSQPEWNERLPANQRGTRVALRDFADSYFNGLDTSGTRNYIPVPFADSCNRWENGIQTTFNNCGRQLQTVPFNALQIGITHRRFPVIDTEKGIAAGFGDFTDIWNMVEMFLIRDGKIQLIQAVLVPWTGQSGWDSNQ